MKLRRLVDRYVTYRRSLGERCQTNASILRAFCRGLRSDIDLEEVGVRQTTEFLYGKGPVTSAWYVKHNALKGFFRYVISREYGAKMPLPVVIPQRPPPFVAYIYSRKELRHLLQATKTYQRNCSCMEPETMRVIVLLLYATGLRVREAVALNRTDVDFDQSLLTVVKSKFYKSRLVPFSPRLGHVLQGYLSRPPGLDRTSVKTRHSSQPNEEIESTNILWKTHSAGYARKHLCGGTMEPAINPVSMICGTPLPSIALPLGIAKTRMCNSSCLNCPFTLGTFIWRPPRFISP